MAACYSAPYPSTVSFRGTARAEFTALDGGGRRLKVFALDGDGRAHVDFSTFGRLSLIRLFYAAVFAGLAALVTIVTPWGRLWRALVAQRGFVTAAFVIVAVEYALVFPGLFNSDLVLHYVNADRFTGWYSAFYFAYNYLFVFIGFDLIQLPPVLISLSIVLLVNEHLRPGWVGKLLLLANLALNPYLFAAAFAGQRYFVAALLALLGVVMLFCAPRSEQAGRNGMYVGALVSLAAAALMRPEYALFWIIGIVYGAVVLLRGQRHRLAVLGKVLAATGLVFAAINVALPLVYGMHGDTVSGKYQMSLLVDLARPYACAGDQAISEPLESFGPISVPCEMGAEEFFWTRVFPSPNSEAAAAAPVIRQSMIERLFSQPLPQVRRIIVRFADTLRQEVWQVFDQYDAKDLAPPSAHAAIADAMGIVHDQASLRPLHQSLIGLVREIGTPRYLLLALAFALVTASVPVFFALRCSLASSTSLAVVVVAVASIVLSPTTNWAYIAIVPLWASYLLPLTHIEIRDC